MSNSGPGVHPNLEATPRLELEDVETDQVITIVTEPNLVKIQFIAGGQYMLVEVSPDNADALSGSILVAADEAREKGRQA